MVRHQTMPPIITLYDVPSTVTEPWAPYLENSVSVELDAH